MNFRHQKPVGGVKSHRFCFKIRAEQVESLPPTPAGIVGLTADGSLLKPAEQKSALQFLDNGMRGFYMRLERSAAEATISPEDAVFSAD